MGNPIRTVIGPDDPFVQLAPDPDWYFEHVLDNAPPGGRFLRLGPAARWIRWWQDQADALVGPAESLASKQGFVVTTTQLRQCGWASHALRREIRRGRWSAPARAVASPIGAAALADPDVHLLRRRRHALCASAAALVRGDHVVSAGSAAVLHGLPVLAVPTRAELTALQDETLGRRQCAHVRRAALSADNCGHWFGVPVTTAARTVVDRARLDVREGIVAADGALREGLASLAELRAELETAAGWPGVRQARAVVNAASPLAESALESLLRWGLIRSGFPQPQLQVEISDPHRGRRYRVDMLWPAARLIVEADGRVKYTSDELWREKQRETRLRALGYRVERVLWADVTRYWPDTAARLWTALQP